MPTYCFLCETCNHSFDKFLFVSNRKQPESENCPMCSTKKIINIPGSIQVFSDSTLTANKKTKGEWDKLMNKMKKGLPKRTHENLDKASSRTGRYIRG